MMPPARSSWTIRLSAGARACCRRSPFNALRLRLAGGCFVASRYLDGLFRLRHDPGCTFDRRLLTLRDEDDLLRRGTDGGDVPFDREPRVIRSFITHRFDDRLDLLCVEETPALIEQ